MAVSAICAFDGCGKAAKSRGYCRNHYKWAVRNGAPLAPRFLMSREGQCAVPECGRSIATKGLCARHYQMKRKTGSPTRPPRAPIVELDRVLAAATSECVIWPFARNKNGYGLVYLDGKARLVSRVICERAHGAPVPPTLQAAHNCGNGHLGCVNPAHLAWKTAKENSDDREVHGTVNRGLRNGIAKVTPDQVRTIRSMIAAGTPYRVIAAQFHITTASISAIHVGKSWSWLT